MSALTCDICGGNLAMNESGDFAVCESCGMKHTKERVKVKVQEVKGVVEITKGEVEKERLLRNAETFIKINDVNKAEEIYEQLMSDYPDDETAYVEYLKLLFPRLSAELSKSEYVKLTKPWSPYSDIKRIISIIQNLSGSKYDNMIDSLWLEHDKKHSNFQSELTKKYNAGEISLYSEIPDSKSAYAPLFKDAQCQAKKLIVLLNGIDPSILLGKFKIKYTEVDVDGFVSPDKIQTIKFVTPTEVICSCVGYYLNDPPSTFDSVCIQLGRCMSVEEIAQIVLGNHQWNSEAYSLISIIHDHESAIREIIAKFASSDTKIRKANSHWESNFSYRITKINTSLLEYVASYKWIDKQKSETKQMFFNRDVDFDKVLIILRRYSNKCSFCGGNFKGVFTKVCTACGKTKNY